MDFIIEKVLINSERIAVKKFLLENHLEYDYDIDLTFIVKNEDEDILGTVSSSKNIIKAFAVAPSMQGANLSTLLISRIISELGNRGIFDYRVFTKPENQVIFEQFNMRTIAKSKKVILLENKTFPIEKTIESLKNELNFKSKKISSLVMNCNPMTLGHLYLIEKCARENKEVVIFILEEDLSLVKFVDRIAIVRAATSHLNNVKVVPSTKYIISSATFPTYFLKKEDDSLIEYSTIDGSIFKNYFMSGLNIKTRYVGNEPKDPVTNKYIQVLKTILGDQLIIVDRIGDEEDVYSASRFRKLILEDRFDDAFKLVPSATKEFFHTASGIETFNRIKTSGKSK